MCVIINILTCHQLQKMKQVFIRSLTLFIVEYKYLQNEIFFNCTAACIRGCQCGILIFHVWFPHSQCIPSRYAMTSTNIGTTGNSPVFVSDSILSTLLFYYDLRISLMLYYTAIFVSGKSARNISIFTTRNQQLI